MANGRTGRNASADSVYAALRERFTSAQYAAGDRLTEQSLAQELGVSRTPVREAIGRLLADGLVRYGVRGVVVAELDDGEREELFALRAVLEAFAAETAARRQASGHLAPIALARMGEAGAAVGDAVADGDRREAARANMRLHMEIARAADNRFLLDTLTRIWDRIAVATIANLDDDAWLREVPHQHQAVIDAISAGDAEAARSAMDQHIRDAAVRHSPADA
jgi:DNA-binding GntR family transcriptional regulator